MYHIRVAGSLFKQVYIAEGMAPPKLQSIQEAYRTMYARAIDTNWWSGVANNGEWKRLALYAVEAYGIFNIGEMVCTSVSPPFDELTGLRDHAEADSAFNLLLQIGRRHLVGYKLDKSAAASASNHH